MRHSKRKALILKTLSPLLKLNSESYAYYWKYGNSVINNYNIMRCSHFQFTNRESSLLIQREGRKVEINFRIDIHDLQFEASDSLHIILPELNFESIDRYLNEYLDNLRPVSLDGLFRMCEIILDVIDKGYRMYAALPRVFDVFPKLRRLVSVLRGMRITCDGVMVYIRTPTYEDLAGERLITINDMEPQLIVKSPDAEYRHTYSPCASSLCFALDSINAKTSALYTLIGYSFSNAMLSHSEKNSTCGHLIGFQAEESAYENLNVFEPKSTFKSFLSKLW